MTRTVMPTLSDRDVDSDRLDDDGAPAWAGQHRSRSDVRLVWAPREARSRLAGAWWPRSRDATTELQALLPAVTEQLGVPTSRVSLNIDAWDSDQPRRLQVGHTLVRVGWFRTLDRSTVTLGRYGQERLVVAVIPHDANATAAQALLDRLSTAAAWPENASEVVDAVGDGRLPAWER